MGIVVKSRKGYSGPFQRFRRGREVMMFLTISSTLVEQ